MSNNARPIFISSEGADTLASSVGGATVKPPNRNEYEAAYSRSITESVAKVNLALHFLNEDKPTAAVQLHNGPHSAEGRLRITQLYRPFTIDIAGEDLVLMYCSVQTYLPDKMAIGGKYFLVTDRVIADRLVSLTDPDATLNQVGKIKPVLCGFVSNSGTINGELIADIFQIKSIIN